MHSQGNGHHRPDDAGRRWADHKPDTGAVGMYVMQGVNINSFWSMEPLLGPVDMAAAEGLPEWVILGAETGNRPDKVTPAREWVDNIVAFCEENEIPVFFKDNLRKYFPDLPASAFPWEV